MTFTELIVVMSIPTVVTVASLSLIAVASVIQWKRGRSKATLSMMMGALISLAAPLINWVSLYTREGGEVEPGIYTSEIYWWDQLMPYVIPFGFLLFSVGLLSESLKIKRGSNQMPEINTD